ncbi:hypothetical protein ACFQ7F_35120 [Streptomyces sp. NPDC056486]|uniref:hypothetical protein n=1 Tax=Streptomyces sp. NPDC056486 TaxID=3345835 RepID=UPI00369B37C4
MLDMLAIGAAILAFGHIAVLIVVITMEAISEWFKARGRIKAQNAQAIAFTLADRIKNKQYAEVSGVFGRAQSNASTRIVQGIFDQRTGRILDARALASSREPSAQVVQTHSAGAGLVVYS